MKASKATATKADKREVQNIKALLEKAESEIPEEYQMRISESAGIRDIYEKGTSQNEKYMVMIAAYNLGFMRGAEFCEARNNIRTPPKAATTENVNTKINETARQSIIEALDDFEKGSEELERARHCMDIFLDVNYREMFHFDPVAEQDCVESNFINRQSRALALAELIARQLEVVNDAMQHGFDMFYACMKAAKEERSLAQEE